MSEDNPSTLVLEDEIPELNEELDSPTQKEAVTPAVKLVSLNPFFFDIHLKERKTIIGRNSKLCSKDAVVNGATVSGKHCEITSRSMNEAEAAIWIRDLSSNGVWINDKRITKDEPVKLYHRDTISFKPGPADKDGTPSFMLIDTRSTKRLNAEINADSSSVIESSSESKRQKLDGSDGKNEEKQDDLFEKEFECGICHDIMHKALALQPCLHSFCKECCKMWFKNSSECPSCRQIVQRTKQDFKINTLIALFLKSRPQLKNDDAEDDGAESDTSNVIRNNGGDNEDSDDYGDDDEDSEDDPIPVGFNALPPMCPCCDPNNTFGYTCPTAFRLGPLSNQPTFREYNERRLIQPGHTQCIHCRTHLPTIPPGTQDSVVDHFRCNMCHISSCGCRLQSVDDKLQRQYPVSGFLNHYEDRVIADYLTAENLTPQNVWQEIKDGMENDTFQYQQPSAVNHRVRNSSISSNSKLCEDCARHFLSNGPLYQWRKNLDPTKLPQTVTSREPCWYGRECRTQFNPMNLSHAQPYMKVNRRHFTGILYDCILFEYGSQVPTGEHYKLAIDDLADTFAFIADFYKHNRSFMDIPCDQFITRNQLHTVIGLLEYIESMERGIYEIYPHTIEIQEDALSFASSSSARHEKRRNSKFIAQGGHGHGDIKSKLNHDSFHHEVRDLTMGLFSHRSHSINYDTDNDLDDEYSIVIPGLSKTDIQTFLWEYAYVPEDYQDDIATLIRYLRRDEWIMNGSKGSIITFDWGLEGVQKFTKEYNKNKIRKVELREQEESKKAQEIAQMQQEEWNRQQEMIREKEIALRLKITDEFIWKMQKSMLIPPSDLVDIDNLIKSLELDISKHFGYCFVTLTAVGSFAHGLYTYSSDLDLILTGNIKDITIEELSNALHYTSYENVRIRSSIKEHATSSTPRPTESTFVTFVDPKTGITCHLSLNDPVRILQSKLIRTYALIEPRFSPLLIVLKHISSQRRLMSNSEHEDKRNLMPIGGYALALMLITFLQTENPPILPKLQQTPLPGDRCMKDTIIQGIDCSFDRDWEYYSGYGAKNTKSASELLVDFCRFFGYVFDYETKEVNARIGEFRWRSHTTRAMESSIISSTDRMSISSPPKSSAPSTPPTPNHSTTDSGISGDTTQQIEASSSAVFQVTDPFMVEYNVTSACHGDLVRVVKSHFQEIYEALIEGDINFVLSNT
ncbi:hypothetical protein BGZ76_002077 [Entomortierella beljakovae]|nr:hypothetical protein BGZ76_002077 [Entomortierella beljakovae]